MRAGLFELGTFVSTTCVARRKLRFANEPHFGYPEAQVRTNESLPEWYGSSHDCQSLRGSGKAGTCSVYGSESKRCASAIESIEIEWKVGSWQISPPAARNPGFRVTAGLTDSFLENMSTLSDLAHDRVHGTY